MVLSSQAPEFAVYSCVCGKTANSYSTIKRHRKSCHDWALRDKEEVKKKNCENTLLVKYGTSDLNLIPSFRNSVDSRKKSKPHSHIEKEPIFYPGLNVEATKDKYGYNPSILKANSRKRVIANCHFCRNDYETPFSVFIKKNQCTCKNCDAISSVYSRLNSQEDKHEFYLKRRPEFDFSKCFIDLTIDKFGHDPRSIAHFSGKKIVAKCDYCSCPIDMKMSKFTSNLNRISCRKCMRRKTVETLQLRYGVSSTLDIPSVQEKLSNPSTEQIVSSILESRYNVQFIRNFPVGPYSFDFFLPSINLLIECQGDYFHNFKEFGYSETPKDRQKSSFIENNTSYKLIWIYEHEIHIGRINKILDFHIHQALEPELNFDLSEITFSAISNDIAHQFLSQYHYLGNLGSIASSFGSFLDDKLVSVCVFGGVTRNQSIKRVNDFLGSSFGPKNIRELRRFCILPNVPVKNLASYSVKRFIKLLTDKDPEVKSILSFSDPNVNDIGTIYKASNWTCIGETTSSYHYMDPKTNKMIHKKTVWDMAKGAHLKETEFVNSTGLIRVNEIPKILWLKKL